MKLFYKAGACSMVPHTALAWIGKSYEAESVTIEQMKAPAYLKLNPQGAVPLLVDGELVVTQNVAILAYLDSLHPESKLFGSSTPQGKALAWRWLAFLNADVHKAFSPLFHAPDWMSDDVKAAAQQAAREQIVKMLKQADDRLATTPWLGGEDISVADVYCYVILRWARGLKLDIGALKRLEDFYNRVAANKGVQAICAQEGLQP
jgi:glutathione S-transferase domain protein